MHQFAADREVASSQVSQVLQPKPAPTTKAPGGSVFGPRRQRTKLLRHEYIGWAWRKRTQKAYRGSTGRLDQLRR